MATRPEDQDGPPPDRALRDAFEAIEAEPIPAAIREFLDRLIEGRADTDEMS